MTEKNKVRFSAESVEVQKAEVTTPGLDSIYGMIKTTFSLPPFRPELRVRVYPFLNKKTKHHREPDIFILTSKQGATMLSAVLRKTADLIDRYVDRLPSKENNNE